MTAEYWLLLAAFLVADGIVLAMIWPKLVERKAGDRGPDRK